MDFPEHEIDFREADRRYSELKRQLEAGAISTEEFDDQRRRLMVQDDEGRWWAKSRKTGEWNYHDGSAWVRGTPPGYQPPRTQSAEGAPDLRSQLEQGERLPSSQTTLPDGAPTQESGHSDAPTERSSTLLPSVLIAGMVLVGIIVVLWILVPDITPYIRGGIEGSSPEEASGPAPGYDLVKDDSGTLSVEVPSEWKEHITSDLESEGEKGKNWSSFLGESVGPSVAAINSLDSWRTGTVGHQGAYLVASKRLAQKYTDDELISSGPNDYSSSCEAGAPRDFDRPPYSGRIREWSNCGGYSDHKAIVVAAAPEGRECVVVLQIGGYFQTETDEENIRHVLDTFETDCSKIA